MTRGSPVASPPSNEKAVVPAALTAPKEGDVRPATVVELPPTSEIAKRMLQTFEVTGDRWFKYAYYALSAPALSPGKAAGPTGRSTEEYVAVSKAMRACQLLLCPDFETCADSLKDGEACACGFVDGPYANAVPKNRAVGKAAGPGEEEIARAIASAFRCDPWPWPQPDYATINGACVRVAARAVLALPQPSEWQPIETAPSDRWILVWRSDSNVRDAAWFCLPPGPGFWYEGKGLRVDPPPTHWRELPAPPALPQPEQG